MPGMDGYTADRKKSLKEAEELLKKGTKKFFEKTKEGMIKGKTYTVSKK